MHSLLYTMIDIVHINALYSCLSMSSHIPRLPLSPGCYVAHSGIANEGVGHNMAVYYVVYGTMKPRW